MTDEHYACLITSAAASYIGSFVCGVRDRHFENIMIRVADFTLFPIDFGYVFGEKVFGIDASPFGITRALRDLMNGRGDNSYRGDFVPICVSAFMALRKNYTSLIKFVQLAFSHIKKEKDLEKFVKERLQIYDDKRKNKQMTEEDVEEWLTEKLLAEPDDNQTRGKNYVREILREASPSLSQTNIEADCILNINE